MIFLIEYRQNVTCTEQCEKDRYNRPLVPTDKGLKGEGEKKRERKEKIYSTA